ncbi:phosphate ABC transporter permease [Picosynechococcus sp. PCC 7003]|uniref:phosphate ABC transporter permease n=1 Tax=Picosynechococcus sp. PCC 7003 TaxID=374981 RepID=UPI0008105AE7|nr:phosphate ABC transporter permease [Picosynechococcus sp. PCC 7003]ANV83835.1 phosphate ABC transporter permease [Picosynechococcus sp. PCC 7003]
MLIPITQEKFEQLIPLVASGEQYRYYWGKTEDFLRRALISFILVVLFFLLGLLLRETDSLRLLTQIIGGLYWFWSPIYSASLKNAEYRRQSYCFFWRGKILDVYLTEEIVRTQEEVDKLGRLLRVENRERRINLEVGDKEGYLARIQAPVEPIHRNLKPGQAVELLVLSNQRNLGQKLKVTDAYIPRLNLWVGLYPYLRRDVFWDVREQLRIRYSKNPNNPPPRPYPKGRSPRLMRNF